jgi:hypothetical protein
VYEYSLKNPTPVWEIVLAGGLMTNSPKKYKKLLFFFFAMSAKIHSAMKVGEDKNYLRG